MKKELTIEAEYWCLERIASYNDNLRGWKEPDGHLIPTEPDPEERSKCRTRLATARVVLMDLLQKFCDRTESEMMTLTWVDGHLYGPSALPSIMRINPSGEENAQN